MIRKWGLGFKKGQGVCPWPCFIVGLSAEASLLTGHQVQIGGGTTAGAEAAAERAVAAGASALVSFGLAGGLDPDLPAGALIIPRFVRIDPASFEADARLSSRFGRPTTQVLLAGAAIVATVGDKRALWQRTGAAAVDLESGAVAQVAARHGLPFAVLRAVCDPAGRDLPPAALIPLGVGGRIPLGRILVSVMARPGQVPGLLALARDAAAARASLRDALRFAARTGR